MAEHHHGAVGRAVAAALEERRPADERAVVAEETVAVQLDEALGERLDVVEGVGPLGMARDLDALPAREPAVDRRPERLDPRLERRDLVREVDRTVFGLEPPKLGELGFEVGEGLFKVEQASH